MDNASDFFAPDYLTARARFRAATARAGARHHALALDATAPGGEALTIDIAWLGDAQAERVLLHTSGLHGVEAFAGSAIQLALLAAPPRTPDGCALVLVHVLNPYGMAWLRRTNENNVDLNRNFLPEGESWSGTPELYRRIDAVLNPPTPPATDFFLLRALWLMARHGFHPLKQAVAQGQYAFPRGLFFGGTELQQGPRRYLEWLQENVGHARYAFAIDVHTGLGHWGEDVLLLEAGVGATSSARLAAALGRELIAADGGSVAYAIRGGMGSRLPRALGNVRIDFVLQEIGTYPPLAVLRALREENRWHHYGSGSLEHAAKSALREALCPTTPAWRIKALAHGSRLAQSAAHWAFSGA